MSKARDDETLVNPRWLAFWRKVREAAAQLDAKSDTQDGNKKSPA